MQISRGESQTTAFTIETKTLPHLFARAAAQVTQILCTDPISGIPVMEKISLEAKNPSLILQGWINKVINVFYEKRLAFTTFEVRQFGPVAEGWTLQVEVVGKRLDSAPLSTVRILSCVTAEISGDEQSCRAEFTLTEATEN